MSDSTQREKAVFDAAMKLPAGVRAAYLLSTCGDDDQLLARVEALLQAIGQQVGPDITRVVSVPHSEKSGDKIGRYKLLEQIGEGGFGVVYVAEQEEPVRRRVALKVIKMGMDTKEVIARFEAERQALALMDHPNIAKVLDAGATDSGRPYFVMELVKGERVTGYCDRHNLPTQKRLNLFVQICHAIQHAHQKGIIHRDIKPSNILVTMHDGVPVPKVIDFGIAKATEQRLTEKTVYTALEQMIGTPAYMSPEQAEMTGLDIDTRSDIYSLGVLLYELLTGKTPFDPKELMASGVEAMRRTIREQEPQRPSTRLTTMIEGELTATAKRRQTDPPKLIHSVRGDLDWIVMKCLEKDRTRRYETVNGLSSDLQRHANNEPVVARPPSQIYRFQKLVHRNKLAFAAASAVLAALIIGLSISTWMFLKEKEARRRAVVAERAQSQLRDEAVAARQKEATLRQQAEADETKAKTEAAKSQQVAQFLEEMLQGVGPSVALGRDTTILREILDKTAERAGKDLTNQPDIEADLKDTLGDVYLAIGSRKEAETMQRRALEIREKLFGKESLEAARSMDRVAMAIYARIASQPIKLSADQESLKEAIWFERQSLKIRNDRFTNDTAETAQSLDNLGSLLREQHELPESESLQRRALAMRRRLFGNESAEAAGSLRDLAMVLSTEGKQKEAEDLLRKAIAIRKRTESGPSLQLGYLLHQLGRVLTKSPQHYDEAEACFLEAIAIWRKLVSNQHPSLDSSLSALGDVLFYHARFKRWHDADSAEAAVKYAEAVKAYREALQIRRKLYGDKSIKVASCLDNLGDVLWDLGQITPEPRERAKNLLEGEQVIRESLAIRESLTNEVGQAASLTNNIVEEIRCDLGNVLLQEHKAKEGVLVLTEGANNGYLNAQNTLAWALATSETAEVRDGTNAVRFAEKAVATTHRKNPAFLDTLAAAYAETQQFDKAVAVQQEAMALLQTEQEKKDYATRLKLYQSNTPYREP